MKFKIIFITSAVFIFLLITAFTKTEQKSLFDANAHSNERIDRLTGFKQGMLAPDFELKRFDGTTFRLSDYKDKKAVYLVFWTTWCTYCMKKIPKLQHAQKILGKQIEIIAVDTSVKDTIAKAKKFQKDRNIIYPLAFDFGKKVTDLYNVWGTPTEFLIDINGRIIHRDGVPDNLSEHLSNWNMIDYSMTNKLIAAKNCSEDHKFC